MCPGRLRAVHPAFNAQSSRMRKPTGDATWQHTAHSCSRDAFAPMVTSLLHVAWLLCACTVCGVQEQHALAESLANSRESELKELKVWSGHEWLGATHSS